jgi:hypothetical protein
MVIKLKIQERKEKEAWYALHLLVENMEREK